MQTWQVAALCLASISAACAAFPQHHRNSKASCGTWMQHYRDLDRSIKAGLAEQRYMIVHYGGASGGQTQSRFLPEGKQSVYRILLKCLRH